MSQASGDPPEYPGGASVEIRGHSRFDRPAPVWIRVASAVASFLSAGLLIQIFYVLWGLDPLPSWKPALALLALGSLGTFLGKLIPGGSIGERIWRIRGGKSRLRGYADDTRGILLTASLAILIAGVFGLWISPHPYWSTEDELKLPAVVPPDDWRATSFYYTLAPWPVSEGGRPVFYSIPYELGPPKRFVGHVVSDWIGESVRITFEGPKTPIEYQARERSRPELKGCFENSPLLYPSCVELRRLTLERHLEEMRAVGYAKFNAAWFTTENPAIPENERAQGVRLRGVGPGGRVEDRYILITAQGLHQSIALSFLDGDEGQRALHDFNVAMGALRISEDLGPERAWTDQLLESIHLDELPGMPGMPEKKDPRFLAKLAEVEATLVSKITVNPEDFEAYYHLAGASMLLLRYCKANPSASSSLLKSRALALIDSLNHYGQDVNPRHPELPELQQISEDAKKF